MKGTDSYTEPEEYIYGDLLYKNDKHQVIKAQRRSDGSTVVMKRARSTGGHIRELSKLGHEYEVLRDIKHEGVPVVYDLLHNSDSITLVQEYFEGATLNEILFKGRLDHDTVFDIAIQLAKILLHLHENGIVHKDLNSSNVILDKHGKIKLIDFGISTNLHFEQNESVLIDHIEGTLTNIAPEQTGRTTYSITHSCDLYSFGILLYELLTGKPPFDSADPLEIIHFHLSRKPIPLSKVLAEVPEGLEAVLGHLLEKNPDDRYQSARGLIHDLEIISDAYKNKTALGDFVAGAHDTIDQYRQTQKLYGRQLEIETLLGFYKHLDELKSMLVLVSGYSGVGKSALISNIKYPIIQDRGIFITGKYDQFKRNIPYYAFIEAFQQLIKTMLSESEEKMVEWRNRIKFAIGENGALITEVIPQLTKIIGKQEDVVKLQPAEQEARFNMVLLDFVYAFSSKHSPLVIFLDDLQWADLPSLNLIKMILTNPRKEGVMILGAFRDNEVEASHPLRITLNELEAQSANINEVKLQALTQENTSQITEDSFGMSTPAAQSLGQLVYAKTQGNPFFINRFLKALYDNKLLKKQANGEWKWDEDKIVQLEYTDNVVDLMIEELTDLPDESQQLIKHASVLGNTFNLRDLAVISDFSQAQVFKRLKAAIKGGYISPLDKKYRTISLLELQENEDIKRLDANSNSYFKFTHDKVQQAAYSLISDFEKAKVHLQTGRILLQNTSTEELQEDVFELLNHFEIGKQYLTEKKERLEITKLCLVAGVKAKDSTSYDLAVRFLNMAKDLLGKGSWHGEYELTFKVMSELGECEYLNNNSEKAESYFQEVLSHAKTRYEKLQIKYVHSSLYLKIGNTAESLRIGLEAVKLYNLNFPSKPKIIELAAAFAMLKYIFLFSTKYRKQESLFNIKDCTDEEIIALNKFLIDLATSAYQQDQNLMMLVCFRIIKSYLKNGFSDASGWGFSGFSVVMLSVIKMQKRGFYLWDSTERMHGRTHSPIIKWRLGYTVITFYHVWKYPIRDSYSDCLDLIKAFVLNGDQIFTSYSIAMYQRHRWFGSANLQDMCDSEQNHIQLFSKVEGAQGHFTGRYQAIKAIAGLTGNDDWDDEGFSGTETKEKMLVEGNMTKLAFFTIARVNVLYYFGHYREALDSSKEAEKYLDNTIGDIDEFDYAFYTALSIAAAYPKFTESEKNQYKKLFKKQLKKVRYWRKGCMSNFDQHYQLLIAELAAIEGKVEKALQLYEKAMNLAAKNSYTYVEAIANERASHYANEHEFFKQSKIYLKDAYNKYYQWGALGKCRQLEQDYPSLLKTSEIKGSAKSTVSTQTSFSSAVSLDLASILKASQSIASQVKYDDLLKNLMNISIENAGAERGCLVLEKNGQLNIEAEAHTGKHGTKILNSIPIEDSNLLPVSLIMYCWRTQENVVIENAQLDDRFHKDVFVKNNNILSMLCVPITEKGRMIGLLYLENKLMKGVFTEERLELLELLSGQIGISIENALLYENLEEKVKIRTLELEQQKIELQDEKEKSDKLLLNILPEQTAKELKSTGKYKARSYTNVTVMFCDIVGFTKLGEKMDAAMLVNEIHEFFSGIDDIIEKHDIEKIKTIGDAYLCANGLSETEDGSSATKMVEASVEIIDFLNNLNANKEKDGRAKFEIRIGIHSGPVIAGVVGKSKFAYDIWGDTVNTAARMESHGEPMKINLSEETYTQVKDIYQCEHRGRIEAKSKGLIDMYFVDSRIESNQASS